MLVYRLGPVKPFMARRGPRVFSDFWLPTSGFCLLTYANIYLKRKYLFQIDIYGALGE